MVARFKDDSDQLPNWGPAGVLPRVPRPLGNWTPPPLPTIP